MLLVAATGAGKSVTFQLPPLVAGKTAIVVSPLIALMQDQVAALTERGIRATFLGSAQTDASVGPRVADGEFQLVYLSPEKVQGFVGALQMLHNDCGICLVAVDEAHWCGRPIL